MSRHFQRFDAAWFSMIYVQSRMLSYVGLSGCVAMALNAQSLPPLGVAISLGNGAWCAAFPSSTHPQPGTRGTVLAPGDAGFTAIPVQLGEARQAPCPAAFPQLRWEGYASYDVRPLQSIASQAPVALIVISEAIWNRDADGVLRADLDGDGLLEEPRRCLAGEGEHLTIWSTGPRGFRVRRHHEYFDWGAEVEPTCKPGEDGRSRPGERDAT